MSIYGKSDQAILDELSQRIKRRRLNKNVTQQNLAKKAGLNRTTIRDVEQGKSFGMMTLIQVLRALEALEELEIFLPVQGVSPLQRVKMQGKVRKRASSKRTVTEKGSPEW